MLRSFLGALAAGAFLLAPSVIEAQSRTSEPLISYTTQHHPTLARKGMVVSQDRLASEAGREILAKGGNAVDAAVATGFALAVTHPQAGNLGGGGFMLVYLADEKRTIAIDYREMAPASAHRDMFLDAEGNVDDQKARFSLQSSGVPGTPMGLLHALEAYGTLPRDVVMAPAIRMAEEGFVVNWALADSLARFEARLKVDPVSAQQFFKADGSLYQAGERLMQPALASTLKKISAEGSDGFYKGSVADAIVATVQQGGGLITHADLENYVAKEREAVFGKFAGFDVATMPAPSSGGVHIIEMLNVLSGYDLKAMGHNSAAYVHHLTETMKYAYADRSKYLGDPDFYNVPTKALISDAHAAYIRSRIKSDRATPSTEIAPTPLVPDESPDTTHFSVMDEAGNMVSNTYTLNFTYGNGKTVAGAGFLLNNEMDDFSSKPGVPNAFGLLGGEANAIEPGKRPLSSMTPVLVFKDGEPFMATGSPGGSTIITVVLQTVINATLFEMNPAEATSALRIHHQWFPDQLRLEPGFSVDTRRILKAMGHNVDDSPQGSNRILGATQTVLKRPGAQVIEGAADPRRPGSYAAPY